MLTAEGCPLCGKKHPPKFHCFSGRTYKNQCEDVKQEEDTAISTLVPRFFCETNYRIRRETGNPKQYTVTILPGFLIPYSTIPVDPVHQAVMSYINESGLMQVGAAQRMNCLNPISFRLFLSRVRDRLEAWISLLLQLVHALEGQVKEVDVPSRAQRFFESSSPVGVVCLSCGRVCPSVRSYSRGKGNSKAVSLAVHLLFLKWPSDGIRSVMKKLNSMQ